MRDNLIELVENLTPEQQAAVREFIDFLKQKPKESPFLRAVDEFMAEHPELLRRLAQ